MLICWSELWRLTWGLLIWRSILTRTPRSPAWAMCTSGGPSSRPRKNCLVKKYLSYNLDEDGRLIIYVLFIWKITWNDLRVHLLFWMSEQLPILLVRSHCGEYGAECCPGPAGQCLWLGAQCSVSAGQVTCIYRPVSGWHWGHYCSCVVTSLTLHH